MASKKLHFSIFFMLVITAFGLAGCTGVDISRYAELTPRLDLFTYFQGNTRGWGLVLDRKGALTRQFTVDITGSIDDKGNLVLDERFVWNDGKRERRVWTIGREDDGRYSGTAADVIGSARGRSSGNALWWSYILALDLEGSTWHIRFSDWMFLQPDGVLLNRAVMSKFGIRVGEVFISFQKQSPDTTGSNDHGSNG